MPNRQPTIGEYLLQSVGCCLLAEASGLHFVLIEAQLDKLDMSPALIQLAEEVSKKS